MSQLLGGQSLKASFDAVIVHPSAFVTISPCICYGNSVMQGAGRGPLYKRAAHQTCWGSDETSVPQGYQTLTVKSVNPNDK